jgi:hypothetical protein
MIRVKHIVRVLVERLAVALLTIVSIAAMVVVFAAMIVFFAIQEDLLHPWL